MARGVVQTRKVVDEIADALDDLRYVSSDEPGLRRRRRGRGLSYIDAGGRVVRDHDALERIKALAIPPAWTDVWICPSADGHLQAVGYDQRGRKQYRYHPRFLSQREEAKFGHLLAFAAVLPLVRERVAQDMRRRALDLDKVAATVVHLLETTLIRVGNREYARANKSFGLTTLRNRHVEVEGGELRFEFKGKSGKAWRLSVTDRRVATIVKACHELPGQHLFQYLDADGHRRAVASTDINAYLRRVSGQDITAKDFRTWAGTVLAANALLGAEPAPSAARAKATFSGVVKTVAARLGNTAAICRKCYIHPRIAEAYLEGALIARAESPKDGGSNGLRPDEAVVIALLRGRGG